MDDRYDYGTFTPESGLFSAENKTKTSAFNKQFKNYGLKQGFIIKVYEIDDVSNMSKVTPEYDVAVMEQNEDGCQTVVTYRNIMPLDSFGGIADYFISKSRSRDKEELDPIKQKGNLALILCLDGNPDKAIMVGAISHANKKRKLTKEDGHALEWEFNGLNVQVADDGGFSINYRSKTDIDGKQTGKGGGSQFLVEGDGSIELNDGDGGKKNEKGVLEKSVKEKVEKFRLDKTKQTVSLTSRKDISIESYEGPLTVTTKGNQTFKTSADLLMEATGSAKMTAKSLEETYSGAHKENAQEYKGTFKTGFEVEAKQVKIKAPKVDILGEKIMLGAGGQPAVISSTVFFGVGFAGWPVFSNAIGPFSTAVLIKS